MRKTSGKKGTDNKEFPNKCTWKKLKFHYKKMQFMKIIIIFFGCEFKESIFFGFRGTWKEAGKLWKNSNMI
jgi:hypothetical protein